jgi:hypothetical protein
MKGSDPGDFDTGLRLAAGSLGASSGRRAIIYLTTGSTNENLLVGPSLAELASLLGANGISFHAIVIGQNAVSPVIEYLAEASGGSVVRATRPEGLAAIAGESGQTLLVAIDCHSHPALMMVSGGPICLSGLKPT